MTRQISRRAGLLAFTLLMLTALAGNAHAQFKRPNFLKATAVAPKTVTPGKPFELAVMLTIDAPYHVQANPATDGYIATEVRVGAVKGLAAGAPVYPQGMEVKISGDKLSVYEGEVKVTVTIKPARTLKPGKITLPLTIHYQGCNDKVCYPPTDYPMTVVLSVGKPAAAKKTTAR
jgi:thiol:disulfide interchange protein DsbD